MEQKKVWGAYFSPTGTTKKTVTQIAKKLAAILELPYETFDFTLPKVRKVGYSFSSQDLVVLGTPVIAGRVPNVLLKEFPLLQGNGALAIPVVSFGNRNYDDALIELRNLLEENGFHTIAGGAFVGEHSFSETLGKGRPDAKDLELAEKFAQEVGKKLQKEEVFISPAPVKGETPIRPYFIPQDRYGNAIDIRKVKPKTSEACDECGICARVCPMGSISFENPREVVGICIKCNACVKKCPKKAKYFDDGNYLYHKEELEELYERRAESEYFLG